MTETPQRFEKTQRKGFPRTDRAQCHQDHTIPSAGSRGSQQPSASFLLLLSRARASVPLSPLLAQGYAGCQPPPHLSG